MDCRGSFVRIVWVGIRKGSAVFIAINSAVIVFVALNLRVRLRTGDA